MTSFISKILYPTNKIVPGSEEPELDKIPQNTSRKIPEATELKLTDKQYANLTSSHMYQRYIWLAYMSKLISCSTCRTPNKSRH